MKNKVYQLEYLLNVFINDKLCLHLKELFLSSILNIIISLHIQGKSRLIK